jgi:transcriptional regulator with XRE-family HTH domain
MWHKWSMNLAQWMDANGYTDAKLAAEVGVSRPFITRIRLGERAPSVRIAARLVATTKLPIEAFVRAEAA